MTNFSNISQSLVRGICFRKEPIFKNGQTSWFQGRAHRLSTTVKILCKFPLTNFLESDIVMSHLKLELHRPQAKVVLEHISVTVQTGAYKVIIMPRMLVVRAYIHITIVYPLLFIYLI